MPLVFWAPAAAYTNDTLVGALAIAFSVLVPGMPGMSMGKGPDVPPGWTYNPSSWAQRAPSIALAFVGFFIARYLTAFQLHHVASVWDPAFGDGTFRVLTSSVSRAWPISDAGLGALSYMLEALSGFMGGKDRWRTMPWMVAMFGFLVVPLGITSIVLVILQPVAVGAWCFLCLVTAVVMLAMVPLAVDEVVAMGQFLAAEVRRGQPFWRTFWMGGSGEKGGRETRAASLWHAMTRGVGIPWGVTGAVAAGLFAMASPSFTLATSRAADSDHVTGALAVTVAAIAAAEVTRAARFLNLPLGLWLAVAPWVLSGSTGTSRWSGAICGVALVACSVPLGRVRERYGAWDRLVTLGPARRAMPARNARPRSSPLRRGSTIGR